MLIKILFEVMDTYFHKGLFICRKGEYTKDKIKNTYRSMPDSYKLNFYFGIDVFGGKLGVSESINHLINDGVIHRKYGNLEIIKDIFSYLQRGDLSCEFQHISNVIENSLVAQLYIEKGNDAFLKEDRSDKKGVNKGDLEKCRDYVLSEFGDIYLDERARIDGSIKQTLIDKIDEYSQKLTDDKYKKEIESLLNDLKDSMENEIDIASVLTFYIAKSFILLDILAKASSKEDIPREEEAKEIRTNQQSLSKILKSFWSKRKQKTEELLVGIYYDTYGILSEVKDRNNSRRIIRQLHEEFEKAYQFPEIVSSFGDRMKWDLADRRCKKSIIWAPNGNGKTTFLIGILFSSSLCFMGDNTGKRVEDKKKLQSLQKFHNLPSGDFFPVFIEASYFPEIRIDDTYKWIYEIVKKQTGFGESEITIENFRTALRKNNANNKLIYLIDGFDEVENNYKKELLTKIENLLNSEYGNNAILVISSRPSFETENFNGFSYWNIKQISFDKNESFIKNFIKAYCNNAVGFSYEDIFKMMSQNHYLREMVTTPGILIDTIIGCAEYLNKERGRNKDIIDIVDDTIDDLIQRIDTLRYNRIDNKYGNLEEIKEVYGVLAFNYFCMDKGVKEGNFSKYLRSSIEQLYKENKRRFRQLHDMIDGENKISDVFFTWLSVLKSDGKNISFLSNTFTEHLAASRVITLLGKENNPSTVADILQDLGEHKYNVFVMLCTMAYYEKVTTLSDEILIKIGCIFSNIIEKTANGENSRIYDATKVRDMIVDILTKNYGENIITNRLLSEVIRKNKDNIEKIIKDNPIIDENTRKESSLILHQLWD